MQLQEITGDMSDSLKLLILDYYKDEISDKEINSIYDEILSAKDVTTLLIGKDLGYDVNNLGQMEEILVSARGYRILKNVAKIPMSVAQNVVKNFKTLMNISLANADSLKEVDGIGEKRARAIVESIGSLRNRIASGRDIIDEI